MTMIAQTAPHRIYSRNDVTHVCFGGIYFSPGSVATVIDPDRKVLIEVVASAGGKRRVEVKQVVKGKQVTETWREADVPVTHRGSAAKKASAPKAKAAAKVPAAKRVRPSRAKVKPAVAVEATVAAAE